MIAKFFYRNDYFFILLLSIFPLFLGGNRPLPIVLFGLLASLNLCFILKNNNFSLLIRPDIYLVILMVTLLLSYLLVSAIFISHSPLYSMVLWVKYLLYYICFIQAILLSIYRNFTRNLIKSLMVMGVLYSVYGLVSVVYGGYILWYPKTAYLGDVTSVFINRNHFSFYACMALNASIYLFFQRACRDYLQYSYSLTEHIFHSSRFIVSGGIFPFLSIFILILAIFQTASRGGMLLMILSVFTMLLLWLFSLRRVISFRSKILLLSAAILFISAMIMGFHEAVSRRFYYIDASFVERYKVWQVTTEMFWQKPLWGHGLGSFEDVFNIHKDSSVPMLKRWSKAHNDYLEILAEYGVFYAVFLWGVMLYMGHKILSKISLLSPLMGRNIVAISVLFMLSLHSIIDFGGQMPAIAVIIITFFGVFYTRSCLLKPQI